MIFVLASLQWTGELSSMFPVFPASCFFPVWGHGVAGWTPATPWLQTGKKQVQKIAGRIYWYYLCVFSLNLKIFKNIRKMVPQTDSASLYICLATCLNVSVFPHKREQSNHNGSGLPTLSKRKNAVCASEKISRANFPRGLFFSAHSCCWNMGFTKDCEEVLIIDGSAVFLVEGWGVWVAGKKETATAQCGVVLSVTVRSGTTK